MISQLLDASLTQAQEKGLASPKVAEFYRRLRNSGHAERIASEKQPEEQFLALIKNLSSLTQSEKREFSELMLLDQLVLNAATSMERTRNNAPLHETFETFLADVITKDKTDDLIEIRNKLLFSIVHTMHPVIWHTAEAKAFEWDMKQLGSSVAELMHKLPPGQPIPPAEMSDFTARIGSFIDLLKKPDEKGRLAFSMTPLRYTHKVTVSGENKLEEDNLDGLKKAFSHVTREWNQAVQNLRAKFHSDQSGLSNKLAQLNLSETLDYVQFRQWGGAADTDGRGDAATSIELFRTIQKNTDHGHYRGPLLDLRQNARIHTDLISGLIQHKYIESSKEGAKDYFARQSQQFATGKQVASTDVPYNSDRNILQQLPSQDQKEFLRQIILDKNIQLVPDVLKNQPRVFNEQFQAVCEELCAILGMDPNTSLTELERVKIKPKHRAAIEKFLGVKSLQYYDDALQVLADKIKGSKFPGITEDASYFELSGVNYRAQRYHDGGSFFERQKTLADGEIKPMDPKARFETLDVIKRLTVVADELAKDEGKPEAERTHKIADRHQIANFSSETDFYAMMLLFKETGLIKIENGLVEEKPKLAIQPLLETGDDMRHAKTIFTNLLKDPLARSYYEKMGRAHFMVGFSDGAKSAGNFASEWQIRQCKKELYKLFRKEFGADFKIDILNGPGRGGNRGGVIEGGVAMHTSPPQVQETAVLDRTFQADEPFDLASSPSYAHEYLGSTIVGTMSAALRAKGTLKKLATDPDYKTRYETYENVCKYLADHAERRFAETVVKDDGYEAALKNNGGSVKKQPAATTLKFLSHIPDNSLRASREPKRANSGNPVKDYDNTRAITIEKGFEKAGLPVHEVGLLSALHQFEKDYATRSDLQLKDGQGQTISPKKLLSQMYQEFDFFHTQVNKRIVNLNNYKPEIAGQYAKASGTEDFVVKVKSEIDGLNEELRAIRGIKPMQIKPAIDASFDCAPIHYAAADTAVKLGTLANALILSHAYQRGDIQPVPTATLNPTVEERVKNRGLSDTIHIAEAVVAQGLVATQKTPERAPLQRQVRSFVA